MFFSPIPFNRASNWKGGRNRSQGKKGEWQFYGLQFCPHSPCLPLQKKVEGLQQVCPNSSNKATGITGTTGHCPLDNDLTIQTVQLVENEATRLLTGPLISYG